MTVKMILAVDRGNAIGHADGRLPWKIPADMKRFKELTSGSDIMMGRKTFESFGKAEGLPNRFNIVITSDPAGYHEDVCAIAASPKHFIQAHQECIGCEPGDIWVIGGATIYDQLIDAALVDEIFVTIVDTNSDADVKLSFDLFNWKLFILHQAKIGIQWTLIQMSQPQRTDEGLYFTFLTLKKTK